MELTREELRPSVNSDGGEVKSLAARVIAVLAARVQKNPSKLRLSRVNGLCDALVHADDWPRQSVLAKRVAQGAQVEEIVEYYIPEAARVLGERWDDDLLSFAEVTVGAARLQETLRTFGERYVVGGNPVPLRRSALLVTPDFEDHVLGTLVAAAQLRRAGVRVQVGLGLSAQETVQLVEANNFSLVGLSVAMGKPIGLLRDFIKSIREASHGTVPVIVGGSIADAENDAKDLIGADLVTLDPLEAMDFCGLTTGRVALVAGGTIRTAAKAQ